VRVVEYQTIKGMGLKLAYSKAGRGLGVIPYKAGKLEVVSAVSKNETVSEMDK